MNLQYDYGAATINLSLCIFVRKKCHIDEYLKELFILDKLIGHGKKNQVSYNALQTSGTCQLIRQLFKAAVSFLITVEYNHMILEIWLFSSTVLP